MSVDLVEYGTTYPIPFRILLNGAPANLTLGTDIVNGDVYLVTQTNGQMATNSYTTRQITVTSEITKVTAGSHIMYYWKPVSAADTSANWGALLVEDVSGGGLFDANMIPLYYGGHASGRYSGGS